MNTYYPTARTAAQWRSFFISQIVTSAVMLGCLWYVWHNFHSSHSLPVLATVFTLHLFSVLGTIRGFTIAPGKLFIHRLLWKTSLPLSELESATPDAPFFKQHNIFDNAAPFSGFFSSSKYGHLRSYVTDPDRAVLIQLVRGKFAVSPVDPSHFADCLNKQKPVIDDSEAA